MTARRSTARRAALGAALAALALGLPALARGAVAAAPLEPSPTAAATPTITPAPGPGLCTVAGRQTADAARVEVGQTVGLQLTVTADCPVEARGRADILLLVDRSASMADDGKHAAALAAVQIFLDNVDFSRHRVGLVPFNDAASVMQTLTDRKDRLERALASSPGPAGSTDIARALAVADAELAMTVRPEAVGVMVVLTDGRSNEEAMFAAAAQARRRGTVLFTIGLGPDANQDALRQVASAPQYFDYAPDAAGLAAIYQKVANYIREFTVTDVQIAHQSALGVLYVPGSAPGEPAQDPGDLLTWRHAFIPAGGLTVTYRVRLGRAGTFAPSQSAWARYVDGDGVVRRFDYAPAVVEVFAPVVRPFFLPLLFRNQCLPAARYSDVALVIDNSSSMAEADKLAQAVAAAKTFTRQLRLPDDQAAVVAFNDQAALVQPLTGVRPLLEARLDAVTTDYGTRIDRGLDLAVAELTSSRHAARNQRVLVLLSDGRQTEEPGRAVASADLARRLGIVVYAVGLGADADAVTLRAVAGSPSRYFRAERPEDLTPIYTQIASVVGCR